MARELFWKGADKKIIAMSKRNIDFLNEASKNQQFGLQLVQATTPSQCLEVAANHGHEINLNDLAAFLTFYKSNPKRVTVCKKTGNSMFIANWGRFQIGSLIVLFEKHGYLKNNK